MSIKEQSVLCSCFKKIFYLFLERGEGREKEEDRNINVWLPLERPPTGDLACNPGICPDQKPNRQPFGSQASAQSTEPHQPCFMFLNFRHHVLLFRNPTLYTWHIVTQDKVVGGGSSRPKTNYIYQKSTMHMMLEHLFILTQVQISFRKDIHNVYNS